MIIRASIICLDLLLLRNPGQGHTKTTSCLDYVVETTGKKEGSKKKYSSSSSDPLTQVSTCSIKNTRFFQARTILIPAMPCKQMQVGYHRCNAHRHNHKPPKAKKDNRQLMKPVNIHLDRLVLPFALVDLQQLQVKGKLRIGRYPCYSLPAVCETCGDDYTTLPTRLHTCNTNIPTLDD